MEDLYVLNNIYISQQLEPADNNSTDSIIENQDFV